MSYELYHYLHLLGPILIFLGYGRLFSEQGMRTAMILTGAGAVLNLVTGFGLLAKMNLLSPFPAWAWIKLGLWLAIAGLPVLAKRRVLPPPAVVGLGALVGAALAWMGWFKPSF